MQWFNHKVTTAAITYAATGDLVATGFAVGGSLLPDMIEIPFKGIIPHRTITHWPYTYAAIWAFIYYFYTKHGTLELYYLSFIAIGCLLHLLQDFGSKSGIPLKGPFGTPKGINLYKIYHLEEYLVVICLMAACTVMSWMFGYLDLGHLAGEIEKVSLFVEYIINKLALKVAL